MRIGLAQINSSVGDIAGNIALMKKYYAQAAEAGCDIIVFPEMSVCGYPPEDLLLKKHFLSEMRAALEKFAAECREKVVIAGFAEPHDGKCFNSLAVMQGGKIQNVYRKCLLPNYGVFDERRYFESGDEPLIIEIEGTAVAVTICEDIWRLDWLDGFLGKAKKELIVNISASPFHTGKIHERVKVLSECAKHFGCGLAYCNMVGGQDELVFDGQSMILDSKGAVAAKAKAFGEDLLVADIEGGGQAVKKIAGGEKAQTLDLITEVYESLVLGTRDYVRKNGFGKVLIGLSGGIDSALTAVIAAEAIGAENVVGITMPSRFNSPETISDAEKIAKNLGIEFYNIPIGEVLGKFNDTLGAVDGWDDKGTAYENLQARIRGTILMSLSNQFSYLVLTAGNKSETAVGYSTLYGDSAGGFTVIKDVYKTLVYELSEYVNKSKGREVIPVSVIRRAPSAELREGQMDSDSLPDYEILDKILKGYIELDKSVQELIAEGLPAEVVRRVVRMVDFNEYKRRQSPPGVKISPKAFGKDRRMPITNRYRQQ